MKVGFRKSSGASVRSASAGAFDRSTSTVDGPFGSRQTAEGAGVPSPTLPPKPKVVCSNHTGRALSDAVSSSWLNAVKRRGSAFVQPPRGFIVPDAALGGAALLACAIAAIIGFSVAAESVEYMHDELVAARVDQAVMRVEVEQLGDRVADDDAAVIASEDMTAWFRALAHTAIVESDRCALEACSCWQPEAL